MADAFNLLQMYQDDDDDDDMEDAIHDDQDTKSDPPPPPYTEEDTSSSLGGGEQDLILTGAVPANNIPTPLQSYNSAPEVLVSTTTRRRMAGIVDYGHDDVAMSPEPEEGEILATSTDRVMFGEELGSTRDSQERSPVAIVRSMTPNNQVDSPQLSAQIDGSQSNVKDLEEEAREGVNLSDEEGKDVDPLDRFLPPPPKEKCSDELQEKINKFLAYKRQGKSFNVEVRNRKDYRNPDFLRHAVRYQDIDEIGSCFSQDVFDPHGYDESDFYDAIEADMRREAERKEQERKKSQKVEFISGGTQAGIAAQKAMLPSPGIPNLPSGGLQSGSADTVNREGRQNKKSKWDKVDGDRKSMFTGGPDNVSAVGAHAALLSAANAGAGYAMFAQQKRREAEERRSIEKKGERRT